MLSLSPPSLLPSLPVRQALEKLLRISSGKSLYGDFGVPNQGFVWGDGKIQTPRHARRYFRSATMIESLFWIVPRASVETVLSMLREAVANLHSQTPAAGLVGVWEDQAVRAEEDPDEVLVGWIGTAHWLSGLRHALEHTGWAVADTGVREVVFDPLSKDGKSPLDIESLNQGRELSDHEQQIVWSALSPEAEEKMYVGLNGHIPVELLLGLGVVAAMVLGAAFLW